MNQELKFLKQNFNNKFKMEELTFNRLDSYDITISWDEPNGEDFDCNIRYSADEFNADWAFKIILCYLKSRGRNITEFHEVTEYLKELELVAYTPGWCELCSTVNDVYVEYTSSIGTVATVTLPKINELFSSTEMAKETIKDLLANKISL